MTQVTFFDTEAEEFICFKQLDNDARSKTIWHVWDESTISKSIYPVIVEDDTAMRLMVANSTIKKAIDERRDTIVLVPVENGFPEYSKTIKIK
jgi:hypothetical protein